MGRVERSEARRANPKRERGGSSQVNPVARAPGSVVGTVTVPGSKSQTNRALVLAALAAPQGTSTISGALRSRDTDLMIGALRTLGLEVSGDGTELAVRGSPYMSCNVASVL